MLRKGVYCYEYMNDWEELMEFFPLSEKDYFHSHLNMEDITDLEYTHAKRDFKDFKINNLGKYRDLYAQIDTWLLADVFENIRNMRLEIYELDSAHFLTAPGLSWQAALKKTF